MKVFNLTGGVGSGKSEVMRILAEKFNADIFKADEIAHELMEPGTECLKKLTDAFGCDWLNEDGTINRPAFAALIFKDQEILKRVNEIVHPAVWKEIKRRIDASDKQLAVVEAAIPDYYHIIDFDGIWYVYTNEENRIQRLMASRGYSVEKCRDIIANQVSEDTFRQNAAAIIDNNGSVEDIEKQLQVILSKMKLCDGGNVSL